MQSELNQACRPLRPVHLAIALLLFGALLACCYPFYRYFVDPDAVAYLTMARRAAEGDTWRLVNALWSPLHPALVALCAHGGMDPLNAAQVTNGIACAGVLFAIFALFRRFAVSADIGLPLLLALSAFLTYALFKQLFCDLWQIAFLLLYLLLITAPRFLQKPGYWVAVGIVMALAAYAKFYSFYFLLLHFPLSLYLMSRRQALRFPWKGYLLAFGLQVALMLPFVWLMHQKYGVWAFSRSGALNTSWTLNGHKTLKPGIGSLIPPPYPNSPYTWEDPWLTEGGLHTRFESLAMIRSQIGHSIKASLQAVEAAGQISPFLIIVLLAAAAAVIRRKDNRFSTGHQLLLLGAGIMPLGYLLLHVEARYIWLLLFAGMILGAVWLEAMRHWLQRRTLHRAAVWIFAASFVAYPVYDMKKLFRAGEHERIEAALLQDMNIKGSFTTNDNPSRSGLLAYWMEGNFYTPVSERLDASAVLADMRRYRIRYYFAYSRPEFDITEPVLRDEGGRPFPEISGGRIPGLRVYLIANLGL